MIRLPARWLAQIRPGERRSVLDAFLLLFGFTCGHLLLETARDALFLARLPASRLPVVYLLIAVIALALFRHAPAARQGAGARPLVAGSLRIAAAFLLTLWALLPAAGVLGYYVLYVFTGVLATLFVVQFWISAATAFTPTQAKRLYPIIGAGAVVGGITGAGFAALIATQLPASFLVLAAAATFGATSLLRPAAPPRDAEVTDAGDLPLNTAVRLVLARPYLVRVVGLLFLAAVTFTLVDFVFKSVVDRSIAPENLDEFFALTYLGLNLLSLLVQVGIAGWLIRRLGVNRAMAVVPFLILVASLGVAGGLGLAMAVGLKAVDGGLRNSLHKTGAELLFVPLRADLRVRVKPLIDVVGQRGGQAIASLLIMLVLAVSNSTVLVAALAAVCATAWTMVSLGLRSHYLNVFRETLDDEIAAARWELPELDLAGLETIVGALSSADERIVVTGIDLAAAYGRLPLVSPLLLNSPSHAVVRRTREVLGKEEPSRDEDAPERWIRRLVDRSERDRARRSLVALGPGILPRLDEALADDALPHAVRRHLPEVIGAFGTAPAASLLTDRLVEERDGMIRFKILRALGRMRRHQPKIPLDRRVLARERERAVGTARRFMELRRRLEAMDGATSQVGRLLAGLLRDKQSHALERTFRMYNLERSNDDFYRAFHGLVSDRRELRSSGRELLEYLLEPDVSARLLELVEDVGSDAVEPRRAETTTVAPGDFTSLLRELAAGDSESIRELALALLRRSEAGGRP